jgi:hypothetical protein
MMEIGSPSSASLSCDSGSGGIDLDDGSMSENVQVDHLSGASELNCGSSHAQTQSDSAEKVGGEQPETTLTISNDERGVDVDGRQLRSTQSEAGVTNGDVSSVQQDGMAPEDKVKEDEADVKFASVSAFLNALEMGFCRVSCLARLQIFVGSEW